MGLMEVEPTGQLSLDLSDEEQETIQTCEDEIRACLGEFDKLFLRVGAALTIIRDRRLYRASHTTFDTYLAEKWQRSSSSGYRMIAAFKAYEDVSPIGESGWRPEVESQLRPLSTLKGDDQQTAAQQRQAAAERAVEIAPKGPDGAPQVTAKHVQQAVAEIKPPASRMEITHDTQTDQATSVLPTSTPALSPDADTGPDAKAQPAPDQFDAAQPAAVAATSVQPTAPTRPDTSMLLRNQEPAYKRPTESDLAPPPASAPVAAAPVTTSSPPTVGGFVTALLPRSEYDWLLSEGLTAGVAIAELREWRAGNSLQMRLALSTEAYQALEALTAHQIQATGTDRSLRDQLEIIIMARAQQAGVLNTKEDQS